MGVTPSGLGRLDAKEGSEILDVSQVEDGVTLCLTLSMYLLTLP
jgi:hypothetical protein